MFHYFTFQLRPADNSQTDAEPPYALFTMHWEDDGPISALLITPDVSGKQAEVVNLSSPENVQTISLLQPETSEGDASKP